MDVYKELITGLRESYEKVRRLLDEQSRHDPPEEPHASRYAARRVLLAMEAALQDSTVPRKKAMLAAVLLNLGCVGVDTEELSEGESKLTACVNTIDGEELQPDTVIIAITALNQLGILWSHREDPLESKQHLDRAETIYKQFKASDLVPLNISDLFSDSEEPNGPDSLINLEKTHTLTLYYLAQIYGSLEDFLKSAVYCHTTLKRQLEFEDYDPIDWALNSATLSQFFMESNGFKQARHHLAAATYILDRYEEKLMQEQTVSDAHDAKVEILKHRSADVARCWAKYGLMLLSNSRDRLLHHTNDVNDDMTCSLSSDLAKLKLSENSSVSVDDLSQLSFHNLDLSIYENQISYKFILTFDDAKWVFQNTKTWIDKATTYYTMDNLASDHLQIMQDASQLFKYLAFFEDCDERRAKMHKRRIDILEKAIKDINPTYYMQYLRQIWYELAEINGEILDIKIEKIETSTERPTPHALNKINKLAEESIKYFNKFLDSLKQPQSKLMPKKFTPETEKAALGAYFQIGRLHMKIVVLDKKAQLHNSEETLKAYTNFVHYCDANEDIAKTLKLELDVSREMIDLLPFKIQKLKREVMVPE